MIQAVKLVDPVIVGVKVLKHWQWLKVHGILVNRYFKEKKMKLLKREVESAMEIQLKTLSHWLISKNYLKKQ